MHGKPENLSRQYADKLPVRPVTHVFEHVIKPVHLNNSRTIGGMAGNRADQLVTAWIHRDDSAQDGVLYSSGQRFGGTSFYIKDNKLKFVYNANKFVYFEAVSDRDVPTGDVTVAYSYHYHKNDDNATVELYINGERTGEVTITRFTYMQGFTSALLANFYSPVTPDYEVPFAFSGRADKIILQQFAGEIDPEEELRKLSSIE
jgi:hypothetical protein